MRVWKIILIISLLYIQSCTSKSEHKEKDSSFTASRASKNDIAFRKFLKKFKNLSLPLALKLDDLQKFDSTMKFGKVDNVFIKSEYPDETYAYGLLPDTTNFYKVIWLAPAEDLYPVMTTFTKTGQKISEKNLTVGGCGSDCGFSCNEIITIDRNLNIYSADSIKSSECDTSGNIKPNTTEKYVNYMTGRILKNGKIHMSKVIKKILNN